MKIKILADGKIEIPEEFQISETKRRLVIRTPYSVIVNRLLKNGQIETSQWFRRKGKEKPYVQEGTIQIDGSVYVVESADLKEKTK